MSSYYPFEYHTPHPAKSCLPLNHAFHLDPTLQYSHRTDAAPAAGHCRRARLAVPTASSRRRRRRNLARRQPNTGPHHGRPGHVRCLLVTLVLSHLPAADGLTGRLLMAARTPTPQNPAATTGTHPAKSHTPARIRPTGARSQRPHPRSEEHTSELQSRFDLVCRLLLAKKTR